MRRATVSVCTALVASAASAMTWGFNTDGDTQGWTAHQGVSSGTPIRSLSRLDADAHGGVLRVRTLPFEDDASASITLVSPEIGHDSGLFDRIVLRLRLIHSHPTEGWTGLQWANEYRPVVRTGGFYVGQWVTFTTDWQEVAFRGLPLVGDRESLWRDELIAFEINLNPLESWPAQSAEDVPEAVEIDWIQLTGVEEQLRGELPPPAVDGVAAPTGELFAPAFFCPLHAGALIDGLVDPGVAASLGDLDGDGDLDLAAAYTLGTEDGNGWLTATNDGTGRFLRSEDHLLGPTAQYPTVQGADLDGDGRMDLVVSGVSAGEYLHLRNDPRAGWVVEEEFRGMHAAALGDADGDGLADLWMEEDLGEDGWALWLRLNDGTGHWRAPRRVHAPATLGPWMWSHLVEHLAGGGLTGALWFSLGGFWGDGAYAVWFTADDEDQQAAIDTRGTTGYFSYIGDLDQDGDVDLLASDGNVLDTFQGLNLLRNAGDGSLVSEPWDPDVLVPRDVTVTDVNGDGHLDAVYVDTQIRSPAVIVRLGSGDGSFTAEGRYPLSGCGGPALTGDVNGDGYVDLVVLEPSAEGQGGVHVLLSRLGEEITAVSEDKDTDANPAPPRGFVLAAAYPNPFNPEVTIPFTLAADAPRIRLTVYNVLGQPVRTLVDGSLAAGQHRLVWNGRDDRGGALPSGVYFHRLEAAGLSITGRCVRAE